MEKYESGTSKAILVKEIDRQHFILIDGYHRLEAIKRLNKRKIEAEIIEIDDKDIYSKAVEYNVEHGVRLTNEEEENVILNFIDEFKSDEEIAGIFHLARRTINDRINKSQTLKKARIAKSKVPTINYFLEGRKQSDIAKDLRLTEGAISQRITNWLDELKELYNTGTPKEEIIKIQNEKNIKLTPEKLNELIEEDYNKLIINDCLKEIPKLDDGIIDCLIIDPPYGIEFQSNYKKEKHDKIESDNQSAISLLDKSLGLIQPKLKTNSHIYIFTSWKVFDKVKPIVEKYFDIKNCLVWNKNIYGMGDLNNNYADSYELIIFASQGKRKLYAEKRPLNILNYNPTENTNHPTEKPVDLLKELISNSTKEGEIVLDYFAGSGSTLKASKECKRKWLGIEIKEYNEE